MYKCKRNQIGVAPTVSGGSVMLNYYVDFCNHIDGGDNVVVTRLFLMKANATTITIAAPTGAPNQWHGVGWCRLNN